MTYRQSGRSGEETDINAVNCGLDNRPVDIEFFYDHRCSLGESPVWDAANDRLWWVDSIAARISSARLDGSDQIHWEMDGPVGSIGLMPGGLIAAIDHELYQICGKTGEATFVAQIRKIDGLRMNDGKMDRQGRFLVGEVRSRPDMCGCLWRFSGTDRPVQLLDNIAIGNAICFSPDGLFLYFADSLEGTIRRYPYGPDARELGEGELFVDCAPYGGAADGATVDAAGNLWVAMVLGQAIVGFDPSGKEIARIEMPYPYPSCPAFGGPDMDMMFVTSISDSGNMLKTDHPDAGRITILRGLGTTGIAEPNFRLAADEAS